MCDVIWASCRLKSPANRLFAQKFIWATKNENIKVPHYWPFVRGLIMDKETTGLTTSWTPLTHWSRVTHICVNKLTIIGSGNGLSPGRRQAIIWTNAGILLNGPLGTNINQILIEIHIFSFKKISFKMSSGKWRPCCLGLNVSKTSFCIGCKANIIAIKIMIVWLSRLLLS